MMSSPHQLRVAGRPPRPPNPINYSLKINLNNPLPNNYLSNLLNYELLVSALPASSAAASNFSQTIPASAQLNFTLKDAFIIDSEEKLNSFAHTCISYSLLISLNPSALNELFEQVKPKISSNSSLNTSREKKIKNNAHVSLLQRFIEERWSTAVSKNQLILARGKLSATQNLTLSRELLEGKTLVNLDHIEFSIPDSILLLLNGLTFAVEESLVSGASSEKLKKSQSISHEIEWDKFDLITPQSIPRDNSVFSGTMCFSLENSIFPVSLNNQPAYCGENTCLIEMRIPLIHPLPLAWLDEYELFCAKQSDANVLLSSSNAPSNAHSSTDKKSKRTLATEAAKHNEMEALRQW
jgi:hypothetical protein